MKYKINWGIGVPIISIIYALGFSLTNSFKIGECILTFNYQVWICDINIGLILFIISMGILVLFTLFQMLSAMFEEKDE